MKTKRIILLISGAFFIIAIILDQIDFYNLCSTSRCLSVIEMYFKISYVLIPVIFFSLLTYKMKDQVFQAWWGFARWFVPLIIASTLVLQTGAMGRSGGGWGISSPSLGTIILFLLYSIFILVSLIKIIWAFIKTRNK